MGRASLLAALLLVGATVAGSGCLEQAREAIGTEPSHRWETTSRVQESVSASDSLAGGSPPTASAQDSFSLPLGVTDLRMTVDVSVSGVGNVTVELRDPGDTVYSRAFSSTTEDTFQTGSPETGQWTVEADLQGESSLQVRVDARVPVD